MENTLKDKVNIWVNKYKYNAILSVIIFILFLVSSYSRQDVQYTVYIDDERTEIEYGIYIENNEQYIHIDDLTNAFSENIYNDKISGKIIITTENNLKKIQKNDETYVVKKDGNIYLNLKKIMLELGKECYVVKDKIYIIEAEYIEASIQNNRVELYDKLNNSVISFLSKNTKVKILVDKTLTDTSNKIVNVVTDENKYGYVLKSNVSFEYKNNNQEEITQKKVLVKAEESLSSSTDVQNIDMVSINMYRLSGVDTLAKLDYSMNISKNIEVYAIVNNGQKSSNYDADILTEMLNSESNRYKVIQKILTGVKNIAGVNIDFGSFKVSDKDNFTQFVKELSAVMHANNKKVIVNVPSTQYIDVKQVADIVDYVIIQPYFARTLAAKTSGPISSVKYVEEQITKLINDNVNVEKVILEIPAYTILWTERKGTVINAEQYSMKTAEQYVQANDLKTTLDSSSGQNYINYTKGITTYKMWLEDEYSMTEKTKLVNKYNLAGISIYKSGFEAEEIYDKISSSLNE